MPAPSDAQAVALFSALGRLLSGTALARSVSGQKTNIVAGLMVLRGILGLLGVDTNAAVLPEPTFDNPAPASAPGADPVNDILTGSALGALRAGIKKATPPVPATTTSEGPTT